MLLLVAKLLGTRRLASWALRLLQLAFFGFLLLVAVLTLYKSSAARNAAILLAIAALCVWLFRFVSSRRRGEAQTGERTIDGKVVPEMLAIAALGVPEQSPDGDYVLRGLPDYGKVLLSLNEGDFEYLPEEVAPAPQLELPEPADNPGWLATVPRWVWASGVAALLIVVIVGMTQGRDSHPVQEMPSPVVVAKAGEESIGPVHAPEPVAAPAPSPVATPDRVITADGELAAEAAPAPASTPAPAPTPTAAAPRYITNPADGLLWTRDNGFDISWGDANVYCNKFSARVPTQAQLETLVDTRLVSEGKYYWTSTQSEGSWPDGKPRYNSYSLSARKWVTLFPEGKIGDRVLCIKAPSQ